ncbi:MAG: BamA/TamA family outer membrane protein [Balneolaceae bacterium]|nr:BamA/TamA family outer membrane protein [Balneolaceae bacterium]
MGNKILPLLVFVFFTATTFAQESQNTGKKIIPIPEFSYSSDFGLKVAGEILVYDYGFNSKTPFETFNRYRLSYSTVGAFAMHYISKRTDPFSEGSRIEWYGFITRNISDYFLGNTAENEFDDLKFDENEFYHFKMDRIDLKALIRLPVGNWDDDKFQSKVGLNFIYERPFDLSENQFLEDENIEGKNGALLSVLESGIVIDKRNSEFRASKGYLIDFGVRWALPFVSKYHNVQNSLNLLSFLPIYDGLFFTSLASRITLTQSFGELPYWQYPALGGSGTIRGFMYRRFTSENTLSYSLEARSWFFKLPYKNIELGGQVFVDGGKAFTNENWDSLFLEHKTALGFGGVMSIFTPDFIMKAEIGFSEDGTGVYLGTGYSF